MNYDGVVVNALHLGAAVAGFAIIDFMARKPLGRRAFWTATFALSAAMGVALFAITEPIARFEDFREAYWLAGNILLRGTSGFEAVYMRGVHGFVNLPIVAFLFAPFGVVDARHAALVFTAIGLVAAGIAWRLIAALYAPGRRESALCLFALACFGPLIYSLREGNISHLMLPLLLWAMLCLRQGRDTLAGAAIAAAVILKPPLALLGIYFALRARWRVVLAAAATGAAVVALSVVVFGLDTHVLWYRTCIEVFAGKFVPGFNVQSIGGAVARAELGPGSYLSWKPYQLSRAAELAATTIGVAMVAVSAFVFARSNRTVGLSTREIELEFSIVLLLACIVSPLSWTHYYVWAIPGFVLAWQGLRGSLGSWRLALFAAFALAAPALFFSAQLKARSYGALGNVATSHLLIGGLILLVCLLRLRPQVNS